MTSTGAFVGIEMLTSYLQSLQLNVNKFSTCTYKLQIDYIITQVTKLFPNCPDGHRNVTALRCCCGPNNQHWGLRRLLTDTEQSMGKRRAWWICKQHYSEMQKPCGPTYTYRGRRDNLSWSSDIPTLSWKKKKYIDQDASWPSMGQINKH